MPKKNGNFRRFLRSAKCLSFLLFLVMLYNIYIYIIIINTYSLTNDLTITLQNITKPNNPILTMSYTDNLPLPYGFGDTTTGTTPTNPTTGLHNRLNLNQIKPGTTHTINLYEFEPDPIQRAKLYASVKNWCLNQTGWVLKKKGTDIIVRRRLK